MNTIELIVCQHRRILCALIWTIVVCSMVTCSNANANPQVVIADDYSFPMRFERDYGLEESDVSFTNPEPDPDELVVIMVDVHNFGTCYVRGAWGHYSSNGRSCWAEWDFVYPRDETVDITYRCRDDVEVNWRFELDGEPIASPVVSGVGNNEHWKLVTIRGVPLTAGEHTAFLGVYQMDFHPDYCLDWLEIGGVHIEAESYARMGGNDPNPDLRGVMISPCSANPPSAYNLTVQIWDGNPESGGTMLLESPVGETNTVADHVHEYAGTTYEARYLPNYGSDVVTVAWLPQEIGYHDIYVVVDPYEVLTEIDEFNNVVISQVGVGLSDVPNAQESELFLSLGQRAVSSAGGICELSYSLARPSAAVFEFYDATGRCVRTIRSGNRPPGTYTMSWDGRDDLGLRLGSGQYYCRLKADQKATACKILLVR